MPTDRPENTPGSAPGSTTLHSTRRRLPPIVSTASSHTTGSAPTACRVETRIGKNAARNVMNTMPCSLLGNSRIAIGTIAMAGIGRSTSSGGDTRSPVSADRPTATPIATPASAASAKPIRIRARLSPRSR
jgi:hypothetical protein